MQSSAIRTAIIGLLIALAGYVFKDQLVSDTSALPYYIVSGLGLLVFLRGLMQHLGGNKTESGRPLADETLLTVLARMTNADSNIKTVEVNTVKAVFKKATGSDVTDAEVRVAARGDVFENISFDKHLSNLSGRLSKDEKCTICKSMVEVIQSDGDVNVMEVGFFNDVCKSLNMDASDVADLVK